MSRVVNAKKRCCQDKPRCKRCPVVLERLEDAGYAERVGKREYRLAVEIPKPVRKAARRRRLRVPA